MAARVVKDLSFLHRPKYDPPPPQHVLDKMTPEEAQFARDPLGLRHKVSAHLFRDDKDLLLDKEGTINLKHPSVRVTNGEQKGGMNAYVEKEVGLVMLIPHKDSSDRELSYEDADHSSLGSKKSRTLPSDFVVSEK